MQLTEKTSGHWQVESDSGSTYEVRFLGRGEDESELLRWSCDCPAGAHGKRCKHQVAVAEANRLRGEDAGLDVGMGDIFGCRPITRRRRSRDRYGC